MTREEKGVLIEELAEKLKNTSHFYIADTGGLTVAEVNNFREMCYKRGVEYRIVKNTLIKKALEKLDTDYAPFDEALKGTSGIMFSPEVSNAPAKIIKEYKKKDKELTKPAFKAASIDSDLFIGAEHLDMLSSLKSKEELIGEIITLLQSPATNVISALQSGKHKLAGIVKTLSEREG
ncbi:large subunit ribosomal protein L10 [Catalinimonas alkaloidigena]|uniref:50S ribosomal protein L10 n=1 Tax=Catalinimonas alkaloidigena TaxID=1075417 RepID=UPI0024071FE3|nr:50S ribosomal protein L10 [Catalinimonas alkaloidigena]MDF9795537.1 large subunit ribosomal protein L10 [Catalinimonas alkaloidigena]